MRNGILAAVLIGSLTLSTPAQIASGLPGASPSPYIGGMPAVDPNTGLPLPGAELPTFNLDFPGGNPELLIEFINEEVRKTATLNAIVPKEYSNIQVPAMKLKNVNVAQLFDALSKATTRVEHWDLNGRVQTSTNSFTFEASYPVTTNSIWYLVVNKPNPRQVEKMCRYYQLSPYLESGLDVNDITTAIKAGYKMLGDTNAPELNFHKETQLLIAVAPYPKLALIDDVLKNLPRKNPDPAQRRLPPPPVPVPQPQ